VFRRVKAAVAVPARKSCLIGDVGSASDVCRAASVALSSAPPGRPNEYVNHLLAKHCRVSGLSATIFDSSSLLGHLLGAPHHLIDEIGRGALAADVVVEAGGDPVGRPRIGG
jgi:hypothetical protein